MNQKIKQAILKALLACDGVPMPESALISGVENMLSRDLPTKKEIGTGINQLYSAQLLIGAADEITGTSWALTTAGNIKARQL
jgi:hypothetical protein